VSRARLRVAVIGSGFGGAVHAPAFARHERFEVVALASPRSAETVARERGIPAAYSSWEEMLERERPDVVSVAAPPFAHHDAVLAALSHGAHVLCEKPFALSVAQAGVMARAAAASGKACAVAHEFRYTPHHRALKELIANGHLGALRHLELTVLTPRVHSGANVPRSWWFERERGGGIAGAVLSHLIDGASWLAGRPPEATAGTLRTALPLRRDEAGEFHSTADDGAFALLDYGGGLIARLAADGTVRVASSTTAVHGDTRTAVAAGSALTDATLFTVDDDETAELELRPSRYAHLAAAHPNLPPFLDLLDAFAARIEGHENDAPTFAEALETQKVLCALGFGSD
jgi:predicted dehydrogenase